MKKPTLFVIALLLRAVVQATPMGNGPYSPAERPPTVPLRKLEFTKLTGEAGFYRSADGQSELRMSSKAMDEGIYLEIIQAGQIRFPKSLMCPSGMLDYGSAYQADLNQDGQPDYVLEYETGGNGLTPVYVIFLLSTGEGYALTTTTSYFEATDFIFVGGKPRFIHTSLDKVEKCNDGKEHSFWVYNLLAFEKGIVKIDNSGSSVFPKIVWYSDAPNYRETTLLNSKQKAELIQQAQSGWREKLDGYPVGGSSHFRTLENMALKLPMVGRNL